MTRLESARSWALGGAVLAAETVRFAIDRVVPTRGVPDRGSAVGARWLEAVMGLPAGTVRSVRVVDEHHGTASRARLAVDVDRRADVPSTLFVKLAPWAFGGRLFMNAMGLGEREAAFYATIAGEVPVRVPRCYGAVVDGRRGRNAIVLEDLGDSAMFRDITDACSLDDANAVVDALADLHARYWASPRLATDLAGLAPHHGAGRAALAGAFVRRVLERPRGLAADLVSSAVVSDSRVLGERGAGIDAFWATQPATLVHNDTHLGNLFFEGGRPGFLDWQNAGVGPGIGDVAYFVVPSLPPDVARQAEPALVGRYVERLRAAGVDVDGEGMWMAYRAAVARYYVGAVVTAAFGDRLQRAHIVRTGVERAVAAVRDLEVFELLRSLTGDGRS